MPTRTMVEALNEALRQAMEEDRAVVVLGEDVGRYGGVFRVTEGLLDRFGPARVIDTPLAESAIVGVALGMAASGLRPVAEIQFAGFLYSAFDQLAAQAARLRARSGGRFGAPLVVRAPYGGGVRAPEFHSDSVEALLCHTPGLKVVIPSGPVDAKGLLLASIDDPDPVVFLEPMPLYRSLREEVPEDPYRQPLGRARLIRAGRDVTVVCWGAAVLLALRAAEALAPEGVEAEVLDLCTLNPLDVETLLESVRRTTRLVVVHEAPRSGGFGAEIAALAAERALDSLRAPVVRVTGWDVPYPAPAIESYYLPSVRRVVRGIRTALEA
ncbi:MAG: alpha-ketoacid dehydrogenase subunit beta [Armatimonadota bacterium]|nr:alpha-ketoacid dehydrogenase subunit beta [Armatimonadota bacterium]